LVLTVEAIGCADDGSQFTHSNASPGGQMENGQGIIRPEEKTVGQFGMAAKLEEHQEAVGQRQSGQIRKEVRLGVHEREQGCVERFMDDESIATAMRGDHRDAFIKRHAQSIRVSDRLIFPDQAEFISHVAQEGRRWRANAR